MNAYYALKFIAWLWMVVFCFSCSNNGTKNQAQQSKDTTETGTTKQLPSYDINHAVYLKIGSETAVLRVAPKLSAAISQTLSRGDSVLFDHEISAWYSQLKLGGISYNEPWLKVWTTDNKSAWIFGGHIQFKATEHPLLKQKILDNRALLFLGPHLTKQMALFQKEAKALSTLPGFRHLYSRSSMLKDSLEYNMNAAVQMSDSSNVPDFFWLNDLLDGMMVYYEEATNKYFIYRDYKIWAQWSTKTLNNKDDEFVALMQSVYNSDSIEYWYPGWQLQVNDSTLCSLMGSGIHAQLLGRLEKNMDSLHYFLPEMQALKSALIFDMTTCKHYWLNRDNIVEEMNDILLKYSHFLSIYDKIALKNQLQLLKEPQLYQITLNYFEGIDS